MTVAALVRQAISDHRLLARGETVVVGVSGGPDSLTLLHVLNAIAPEMEIALHVAHLDHQLRGADSDADAAFVAALAREWNLPATVEARPVAAYARERRLSMEEAARSLRYEFLGDVAARLDSHTVAVAHTADDQVETLLMHFLRGAGLAGLRGMAYKSLIPIHNIKIQNQVHLVRPLLDVTRAEIEAYCRDHGLQPRLDATNLDTTIYRNRLRREVIPYLERLNPNLRAVLLHSARILADDYDYLREQIQAAFEQVARGVDGAYVFDRARWCALPPSLQRATLREAVQRLREGLRNINWAHVEGARRVALEKQVGAEALLPQGLVLVVGYDDFTIGETVPQPDLPLLHEEEIGLQIGAAVSLPGSDWMVRVCPPAPPSHQELALEPLAGSYGGEPGGRWSAEFDADRLREPLVLRTRRAGERFQPSGLGGHKSLHEFMIDEKIPRHLRDLWPILADEEKILWVCGYRVDERVIVRAETRRVLKVEFLKESGT